MKTTPSGLPRIGTLTAKAMQRRFTNRRSGDSERSPHVHVVGTSWFLDDKSRVSKQMNTSIENNFGLKQGLPPPSWKTALVPVDFSPGSMRATRLGAEIAQQNGGRIVVLHVIAPSLGSEGSDFCFVDEAERQVATRLNLWLATHLADFVCETDISVRVSASLEFTILLEARRFGVDVIILSQSRDAMLGAQGTVWNAGTSASHGAVFRMAEKTSGILRHASCPIITVNEAFPKSRVRRASEYSLALA